MSGNTNTNPRTTEPKLVLTGDRSHTLTSPFEGEHYHSVHGAVTESMHVFISAGLEYMVSANPRQAVQILEVGLGTGLNALLACEFSMQQQVGVHYTSLEPYPLSQDLAATLNYPELVPHKEAEEWFKKIHSSPWENEYGIHDHFHLKKVEKGISDFTCQTHFDVCFFDAFGPRVQPEMWDAGIFNAIRSMMKEGGVLVTYSCKGDIQRALKATGFTIQKLPGPPGKREMLRATAV